MVSDSKRIAKNTVFLYIRMIVVMAVSIYTSRVILSALGVTDYGIYNVVGGIVTMMGFINGALGSSTSRFLTYELGTGNKEILRRTFAASLNLHIAVALAVLLVGETIGLWFFFEKMVIPENRINAAFWVFQFSIITTMISFTQVPYNASLISHENMSVYAYVGLYEAFSKLFIVYLISYSPIDKLIFFAFLIMLNSIGIQLFYRFYTTRKYEECRFKIVKDKTLYRRLMGYSGWDLIGNLAVICQNQGMNILLNLFFGPAVNAARAVAIQIQTAVTQFTNNFLTAVRPQVVKKFAEKDYDGMYRLTFYSTKYSFMMMLALILPFLFEMDFILKVWLGKNVPDYTATFALIILITSLVQTWSSARNMAYHAIGRIRTGNLIGGIIMIMSLPISYIALRYGAKPQIVFWVIFVTNFIVQIVGIYLIYSYVHFDLLKVVIRIYLPCIVVATLSMIVPYLINNNMAEGWGRFLINTITSEFTLMIIILVFGLSANERKKGYLFIKNKICRN